MVITKILLAPTSPVLCHMHSNKSVPCFLSWVHGSWVGPAVDVLRDVHSFQSCSLALLGMSSCTADSSLGDTLILGFRGDPFSIPNDFFGYKAWQSYRAVGDSDTKEV